jgi:hypothetical protein
MGRHPRGRLQKEDRLESRHRGFAEVRTLPDTHDHQAIVHEHEHTHVTHYDRPGEETTHMVARHAHEHNHPALSHDHEPHEDPDKEHLRESHVHDHARPDASPA